VFTYHPGLQRFISEDPIRFGGGDVNLYAYVANRPLRFIDPLGHEPVTVTAATALTVACVAGAVAGDVVVFSVNGRKTTMPQLAVAAGLGCVGGVAVAAGTAVVVGGAAWAELTAAGATLTLYFDRLVQLVNNQAGAITRRSTSNWKSNLSATGRSPFSRH